MPQVSKYPLDKDIEYEMFQQFWTSVSKLQDPADVRSFLSDLLSDVEEVMLAKRFTVAVLILRGKKPVDIARTIHVSFSTIRSVASWVKNAKPRTRRLLESVIHEEKWQKLFDRIEVLIDKLPPAYGTDWSEAGKEKWRRKMKRTARQTLR